MNCHIGVNVLHSLVLFTLILGCANAAQVSINEDSKGSNSIDNIENTFSQVFDSIKNVIDALDPGCKFVCPNGAKPRPHIHHVPSSNGCGSLGIKLDTTLLPEMTGCCDLHDRCYDTCNRERDVCDQEFKDCLNDSCKKFKRGMSPQFAADCRNAMNMVYSGVATLGCQSYKEAQTKACICKNTHRHENPIYNDM